MHDRPLGDDAFAGHGARYEILPGHHVVTVRLDQKYAGVMFRKELVSDAVKVHFDAVAGHSYFTAPLVRGQTWEAHVVDEASRSSVSWSGTKD